MTNLSERIDAISRLAKSKNLHSGKFKEFLSESLIFLGDFFDSDVRFWLNRGNDKFYEAIQRFSLETGKVSGEEPIALNDFPEFNLLISESYLLELVAGDNSNQNDASTSYLIAKHLKSWVSIQVWSDRRLFGAISLEWKSKRAITDQDKSLLFGIAALIGQCYDGLLRLKGELLPEGNSSEAVDLVLDSEAEKLQKKLSDHAFFTSHNIRHPLSTILALVDLIKINWDNKENYEEHLQQLKIEAMNLDEIIRVMTAKIELD